MATYSMNSVLVFSLMFFVMISSLNAQKADVAAICGKAKNPAFCNNFLKGKASGVDVKTLAQTTLAAAQASASVLAQTAAGSPACKGEFQDAISSLNEAKQSIASNDGQGLNMKVSAAMTGVDCAKNSEEFQNLCGIVLVLSNMMGKA